MSEKYDHTCCVGLSRLPQNCRFKWLNRISILTPEKTFAIGKDENLANEENLICKIKLCYTEIDDPTCSYSRTNADCPQAWVRKNIRIELGFQYIYFFELKSKAIMDMPIRSTVSSWTRSKKKSKKIFNG